jgi:hypothetical protein
MKNFLQEARGKRKRLNINDIRLPDQAVEIPHLEIGKAK